MMTVPEKRTRGRQSDAASVADSSGDWETFRQRRGSVGTSSEACLEVDRVSGKGGP